MRSIGKRLSYKKDRKVIYKMAYIGNTFSLQMIEPGSIIMTEEISPKQIPADVISCIGHADTAKIVSDITGLNLEMNRVNVYLRNGEEYFVAQLCGGRLPEGTTKLPPNYRIKFIRVKVFNPNTVQAEPQISVEDILFYLRNVSMKRLPIRGFKPYPEKVPTEKEIEDAML